MRPPFPTTRALAAHLLSLLPLLSPSHSTTTTTTQVQTGDTLWRIAQSHNLTVASLQAANPGISANDLQVGQAITVPVADDVPAIDDMVSTPVFASSSTVKGTASVTSSDDVPAMSDMVTGSIVYAPQTGAIFQVTNDDVPVASEFVSGPIVFATPTTLVTSSRS